MAGASLGGAKARRNRKKYGSSPEVVPVRYVAHGLAKYATTANTRIQLRRCVTEALAVLQAQCDRRIGVQSTGFGDPRFRPESSDWYGIRFFSPFPPWQE